MKYRVYLRSGKPIEIEGNRLACIDQKNEVYKIFYKDDPEALNERLRAIIHKPDAILLIEDDTTTT